MLFGVTVAVYCKNHTEEINAFSGEKGDLMYVKVGSTYSDHWASKG
jgi:hypothetical protein